MNAQNRVFTRFVNFTLALVLFAAAIPCLADDKELAREKYQEGMEAIKQENYPAALRAFEESYKLNPKPGMLYNIANCKKALFQYSNAIEAFELYLEKAGAGANPALKKDSEEAIRELNKMVGKLIIKDAPDGAQVILRGESVGETPLAKPLLLDPGQYPVRITKTGYEPMETAVTIAAEAESVINAALQSSSAVEAGPAPLESVETPPPDEPVEPQLLTDDEDKGGKPSGLFWVSLGGTVVTGALAGVFFGLQSSTVKDYDTTNDELEATYNLYPGAQYDPEAAQRLLDKLSEHEDSAEKYNKTAIAMTIAASALAVTSVIILVANLNGDKESESNVSAGLSPTGLVLTGRF